MGLRLLLAALLALAGACAGAPCYLGCRFRFCDGVSQLQLAAAGTPASGAICDYHGRTAVGAVARTGEAELVTFVRYGGRVFTPLSRWAPRGLRQPFDPLLFKTFMRAGGDAPHTSAVGRAQYRRNQAWFVKGRCFLLPLRRWAERTPAGDVPRTSDRRNNCIAFSVAR